MECFSDLTGRGGEGEGDTAQFMLLLLVLMQFVSLLPRSLVAQGPWWCLESESALSAAMFRSGAHLRCFNDGFRLRIGLKGSRAAAPFAALLRLLVLTSTSSPSGLFPGDEAVDRRRS